MKKIFYFSAASILLIGCAKKQVETESNVMLEEPAVKTVDSATAKPADKTVAVPAAEPMKEAAATDHASGNTNAANSTGASGGTPNGAEKKETPATNVQK